MHDTIVDALASRLTTYETSNYTLDDRGNPTLAKVTQAREETRETALKMLTLLEAALPDFETEGPFQISLLDSINNFGHVLEMFMAPLFQVESPGLFADIRGTYYRNQNAAATQILTRQEILEEGATVTPSEHPWHTTRDSARLSHRHTVPETVR